MPATRSLTDKGSAILAVRLLLSEHTLSCLFHKQLPYPNHFITIHNNPAI